MHVFCVIAFTTQSHVPMHVLSTPAWTRLATLPKSREGHSECPRPRRLPRCMEAAIGCFLGLFVLFRFLRERPQTQSQLTSPHCELLFAPHFVLRQCKLLACSAFSCTLFSLFERSDEATCVVCWKTFFSARARARRRQLFGASLSLSLSLSLQRNMHTRYLSRRLRHPKSEHSCIWTNINMHKSNRFQGSSLAPGFFFVSGWFTNTGTTNLTNLIGNH
jgi:hypothetical protein